MFERYLGIDFSGDALQWGANVGIRGGRRAVWIVDVIRSTAGTRKLKRVQAVQELLGTDCPFERLVRLLNTENFNAVGIDAPFSIPTQCLPRGGLKELIDRIDRHNCQGRPFPNGSVLQNLARKPNSETVKPLRKTEEIWKRCGPRSTVWHGARPGTPFTVACLKLIARCECPVWPWRNTGPRLLVEAFPAAQLTHWRVPFQGYQKSLQTRRIVIDRLAEKIEIEPNHRLIMEKSGDALDAVICAFAAEAVVTGNHPEVDNGVAQDEGWIAVLD